MCVSIEYHYLDVNILKAVIIRSLFQLPQYSVSEMDVLLEKTVLIVTTIEPLHQSHDGSGSITTRLEAGLEGQSSIPKRETEFSLLNIQTMPHPASYPLVTSSFRGGVKVTRA
jgi:hypothetical protein